MATLILTILKGSTSLYIWALEQTENSITYLLYPLVAILIIGCLSPGLVVWKILRKRSRYAALYGLMVAAVVVIVVPIWLGVPFGSYPL
jgi:hypothetical protein